MAMLFVIGVLMVAVAAALIARALAYPRIRMSAHLRQIDTYGFKPQEGDSAAALLAPRPPLGESMNRVAERIGRSARGQGWRAPVEGRSLRAAGVYALTADAFHGFRVMGTALVPGLIMLLGLASGSFGALNVLQILVAAGLCWFGPALIVRSRAQRRMDDVDRALPELIDVLAATMEAGLGFAGSLQMVAGRFGGPLGQELRLTLQEQRMGLSSEQALSNMLERCDTPSVRAFVRAVQQGESLGVSIAGMMRNLASETRKRRRQIAQARIQKAPVKMLFPLVFLIFPALLIVVLYPAVTELVSQLAGAR
jgi:tight adherence protein C